LPKALGLLVLVKRQHDAVSLERRVGRRLFEKLLQRPGHAQLARHLEFVPLGRPMPPAERAIVDDPQLAYRQYG